MHTPQMVEWIAVDNFHKLSRVHFCLLTHFHSDHYPGLTNGFQSCAIVCSSITKKLAQFQFPDIPDSSFIVVEPQIPCVLNGPSGSATVTSLDANHCPGSLMFLVECSEGIFLYTGDFRNDSGFESSLRYLKDIIASRKIRINRIFLDTTFYGVNHVFPSKLQSSEAIVNLIYDTMSSGEFRFDKDNHRFPLQVFLHMDTLGCEIIAEVLFHTFGFPIHVDSSTNPILKYALQTLYSSIVTEDSTCTPFHIVGRRELRKLSIMVGTGKLNERGKVLLVRPAAQWIRSVMDDDTKVDSRHVIMKVGPVWKILFSSHSSLYEIRDLLCLIPFEEVEAVSGGELGNCLRDLIDTGTLKYRRKDQDDNQDAKLGSSSEPDRFAKVLNSLDIEIRRKESQ